MSKSKQKKKSNQPKLLNENKNLNYFLLSLFVIFLVFFTTFKIGGDDDVFWHLATGKYVVETKSVPSTDMFGWQTEGVEWMPFEWGWDVITFGIFSVSGYEGISIFRTLIFIALFGFLFLICKKNGVQTNLMMLFSIVVLFGIMDRLTPRPHIISLLFFLILLYLLISSRYRIDSKISLFYFIPPLFIVWSNLHMGVIAGVFIITVFYFIVLYDIYSNKSHSDLNIRKYSRREVKLIGIIFLLSGLCLLINPNGLATYIYAYEHTQMKLLETINEWRSPFDDMFAGSFIVIIYKLLLAIGLITLYYSYKTKDWLPFLMFLFFAIYSVRAIRFTVDYIIIATPFILISLNYFIHQLKDGKIKQQIQKGSLLKVVMILFLVYGVIRIPSDSFYLDDLKYYRVSGFGINDEFIPEQLFDFMEINLIPSKGERVLNHFGTGGYFVWRFPGEKNFIDSRNLNDEIFELYDLLIGKKPGFENRLQSLNIDYAVYLAPDLVRAPQEMEVTIVSYFEKEDEWKLLFWDDKSFLYVKDEQSFSELIDEFEYKYITPYNFLYNREKIDRAFSEDAERVQLELLRKQSEEPEGIIINTILQNYNIRNLTK